MLQNAYFLAKIGADTAENEQHFAEILPTDFGDEAFRRWPANAGPHLRGLLLPDLQRPRCLRERAWENLRTQ